MPSTPATSVDAAHSDNSTRDPETRLALPLRRPRLVLVISLLLLILAAVVSGDTLSVLKNGGFDDPASDSVRATTLLEQKFPSSQPNLVVLVRDAGGDVDAAAAKQAGKQVLDKLSGVSGARLVASYFAGGDPTLRSKDGHAGLTLVRVDGNEDAVAKVTATLHDQLDRADGPVTVRFGGIAQVDNDLSDQTNNDLALSEAIALPLTLILLFLVFRGLMAALLPMMIGLLSIVGSLAFLDGLARATSVSVFAVNLITALGLGLAVDYSLLIVSRYRDERARGRTGPAAVTATLRTAGRTVVFSAAIVAAVLTTLLVFDQYFLRSFALAGVAVVIITVLGALLPLPAALLLLGDRIDKWSFGLRRSQPGAPENRLWGRVATAAMRRPLIFGAIVVALLAAMAWPITSAQFGVPDERALPQGTESRVVAEAVRTQFGSEDQGALAVVATDWSGDQDLTDYATRLSNVPHVTAVNSAMGRFEHGNLVLPPTPELTAVFKAGSATRLQVLNDVVPYSDAGQKLVEAVRTVPVPANQRVYVGGLSAQLADITKSIGNRLPVAVGLAALLTLVLLCLATGSLLLPVKAVAFNVLGLGAILGAMVWVFQQGNLAGLLGVTPSPIAVTIPVLLLCIAYGLSMDYEMFVLSRIKESYDANGDPYLSVRQGLGGSGPIISAAAAILAVSFFSTAISGVSLAKLFGIGTGLAVIIDALLIRGVLVPAFLRIFGRAAWWAPSWLRRITRRISVTVGH